MLNHTQTLLDKDDFGDAVNVKKASDPEVWREQYEVCLQYRFLQYRLCHWLQLAASLHGICMPNIPCLCLMYNTDVLSKPHMHVGCNKQAARCFPVQAATHHV